MRRSNLSINLSRPQIGLSVFVSEQYHSKTKWERNMHHKTNRFFVRLLALIGLVTALSQTAFGQVISDSFKSANPNTTLWSLIQTGGPSVAQKSGKAQVFFPETSAGDIFYAGYASMPWIVGDYDIQVDYALPVWPFASGVRVGLSAVATDGSAVMAAERVSFGNNDYSSVGYPVDAYLAHYVPGDVQGITGTNDQTGTLRLARTGDTTTAYYWNPSSNQWVYIHSAQTYSGAIYFGLSAWSHDYCFTKQRVKVHFDNFRVNSGAVIFPITPLGLDAPLAPLAPQGTMPTFPAQAFQQGQNLPLKLQQMSGGQAMTTPLVSAPKIVGLSRDGKSLDLSTLNLDAKAPHTHNVLFSTNSWSWVYCLRTKSLRVGVYVITLEMSDGRRYDAGFELK